MALPYPPTNPSTPIPNNPFFYPQTNFLQGEYGPFIVGSGLSVDQISGTISSTGGGSGVSSAIAGPGISVSGPTGAVTFSNTGVRQLAVAGGLSVNTATGNVTVTLDPTGVTPGSYSSATITVDAQGRISAASGAPASDFGSFYDTTIQINSGSTNVVQLSSTENANNFTVNLGSQIVAGNTGFYNLQFSAQMTSVSAFPANVYFWIKKNGVNVPNSTRVFLSTGLSQYNVAGFNYIVEATNAGDYFEIVWESPDFSLTLESFGIAGAPNVRSAVATIVPVGA